MIGKFEILLVRKPKNIVNAIQVILKALKGNLDDRSIYFSSTNKIDIVSEEKIEWEVDGLFAGNMQEVKIHNIKQFTEFIAPNKKEA